MQIVVNTKYNIGDIVYVANHYYDFYPISKPYTVKNILINGNSNKIYIDYEVEQDEFIERVPEHWIFSTYAECTKWCDEKNKIS